MVRIGLVTLVLLAAFLIPPASARMLGDPAVSFSADRLLTLGERSFTGKVYAMPGSQRHEQLIQGIPQVIILHGEDAKGWLVLPALNSYVEFGFAPAAIELSDQSLLSTRVGEETIEGRRTTQYRVEHAASDGSFVDGYVWLTREGIPMRLDGNYTPRGGRPTPVHMELSHVRVGPQDAALFAVPANMVKLPTNALAPLMGLRKAG
jgi:hypothetical protein